MIPQFIWFPIQESSWSLRERRPRAFTDTHWELPARRTPSHK